jgi:hypothetical protein
MSVHQEDDDGPTSASASGAVLDAKSNSLKQNQSRVEAGRAGCQTAQAGGGKRTSTGQGKGRNPPMQVPCPICLELPERCKGQTKRFKPDRLYPDNSKLKYVSQPCINGLTGQLF